MMGIEIVVQSAQYTMHSKYLVVHKNGLKNNCICGSKVKEEKQLF